MEIRLIENNDVESYMECVSDLNKSHMDLSPIDEMIYIIANRPMNIITWVGIIDNKVVATATMIIEKKLRYSKLCCHIEDVAVHKDFRNRGLGSEMIKFCIIVAKDSDCYKIILNCDADKQDFYSKLGFVKNNIGMIYTGI